MSDLWNEEDLRPGRDAFTKHIHKENERMRKGILAFIFCGCNRRKRYKKVTELREKRREEFGP